MGFNTVILGARLWIWLYFFISLIMVSGALAYFYREKIRYKYYMFRFPEKLVKLIIHYKSGLYRIYWRIIPADKQFMMDGKIYHFNDKNILKENNFYAIKDKSEFPLINIDNKKYRLNEIYGIKLRKTKHIELHYWFNNPSPIDFNFDRQRVDFNSSQLQSFKDNDLFTKLLTLSDEKRLMVLILVGIIVTGGMVAFLIAKTMEWL